MILQETLRLNNSPRPNGWLGSGNQTAVLMADESKLQVTRKDGESSIFYDPVSGCYGFSTRFPGHPPHRQSRRSTPSKTCSRGAILTGTDLGGSQRCRRNEAAYFERLQGRDCRLAYGPFNACGIVFTLEMQPQWLRRTLISALEAKDDCEIGDTKKVSGKQ